MFKLKKCIQFGLTGLMVLIITDSVFAQNLQPLPTRRTLDSSENIRVDTKKFGDYDLSGLDNKVNLETLQAWDVVQLIQFLASRGGLNNIIIGKGVAGLTTKLKFDNVTVREALEVVLSVNNLAYTVNGGIITIMSDAEYQHMFGVSFYDNKQVKLCKLKYADPVRVAALLAPVKSSIGTVVSDQMTGTLILIDTPEKIREMQAIIAAADINTLQRVLPTETKTFVLRYADIADVEADISKILSKEAGSIHSNERLRTLIVTDLPHKMREIEQVIAMFDRRRKEVFIEAKIIEIVLRDSFEMGVNWDEIVYNSVNPRQQVKAMITPGLLKPAESAMGLNYKTITGGMQLSVIIQALKRVSDVKVVSNPHVAVLDGETATVNVNKDEPYVETRKDSIGQESVAGTEVKFIPVGVSLSVTPHVLDQMIMAEIRPEVSRASFKEFSYGTDDNNNQIRNDVPVVTKSYTETKVMVKSGETIIIAGMIQESKEKGETRVPILGRIPLLGLLFKNTAETSESRELAIFLTPRIITGEKPFLRMRDIKKAPKPLRAIGPRGKKRLKALR
jgi:type II secretory pathway component GspD/PulD (secretin)